MSHDVLRDELPFRNLERAHRRVLAAERELASAYEDRGRAITALLDETGLDVRLPGSAEPVGGELLPLPAFIEPRSLNANSNGSPAHEREGLL